MGVGTFKNWLLEQEDNAIKQQIIDLLDELSNEEVHEFGEFLYDEFFEFSEVNFEDHKKTQEYEEVSKEEIIGLLDQLDSSTYEYILDMLQFDEFDEFETNESELEEGKNIGTIYHFTTGRNLKKIVNGSEKIDPFVLMSWNNTISTTRNSNMSAEIFRNDFNINYGYIVRIALDGNKISQKYKIKPVAGYINNDTDIFNQSKNDKRVKRYTGEHEEVVLTSQLNILSYIKQIDIYNHNEKSEELYNELKNSLTSKNIKVNLVRKFSIVENVNSNEYFEIILDSLEESVSRVMKASNINRKKRKFFTKGAGTMRKEKSARQKENRANRASRKRYARANKSRISSYQKSRAEKIKSGKHNIKLRRKGV